MCCYWLGFNEGSTISAKHSPALHQLLTAPPPHAAFQTTSNKSDCDCQYFWLSWPKFFDFLPLNIRI